MLMYIFVVWLLLVRFFLGSNKVMQVALGRSASEEIRPGVYKVSRVRIITCLTNSFLNTCKKFWIKPMCYSLHFWTLCKHLAYTFLFCYSLSFCVEILDWCVLTCQKKRSKGIDCAFDYSVCTFEIAAKSCGPKWISLKKLGKDSNYVNLSLVLSNFISFSKSLVVSRNLESRF